MSQQIVLVTGASSGIGRAIAREFIRKGFKVYGTSRDPEKIQSGPGGGIIYIPLDITVEASRRNCVEKILKLEGRIDVLVNNAGYGQMGALMDVPVEKFDKQLQTNLVGPASLTQLIVPSMIQNKSGMVVNISSISGVMASAFSGVYCASKAAMNAWSDTLRMELKPFNIRVITVQPGAIQSNFGNSASQNLAFNEGNSSYAPIADFINKRAAISQEGATSSEAFARQLVNRLVKKHPKAVIRIGKSSFIYPFLKRWLPVKMLDGIILRKFGLKKLKEMINTN